MKIIYKNRKKAPSITAMIFTFKAVCPRLFKDALQMENRQPQQISREQQPSEVSSGHQYMPLVKARQSSTTEVIPSTEGPSLGQYEPLQSSTISYEIFRQNVIIEKIIGKGAFGQVAKGKVKDLRGKPHVTQVAVKMLKGKRLIDHCNQHFKTTTTTIS